MHADCQAAYDELEASSLAGDRDARVLWRRNLYCVDLAGFRRGFYTIIARDVFFLDIVDHEQYDKWFPNKGK